MPIKLFPDGKSTIGYNSDTSEELEKGTRVCIISLGASRLNSYRNKKDCAIGYKYLLQSSDF